MLSEIDRAWRKDKSSILKPAPRPGFRVFDDNGVAMIFPDVELSMAVVEQRLRARAKNVKNKDMKMYTDGTLVAIDPTSGQRVSNEPAIVALNETLIIFIIPALDPVRVGRIDVAKP